MEGLRHKSRLLVLNRTIAVAFVFIVSLTSSMLANGDTNSRYALIIGNSAYHHATPLGNPRNDSEDIAEALQNLFFDTKLIQDATKQQIETAVTQFLIKLKQEGGTGLFYYAGHGVQLVGDNYLLPIETDVGTEQEIQNQSFNVSKLLAGMRQAGNETNIIILDACRDNPFKNQAKANSRSAASKGDRGMVKINVPKLDSGLSKLDAPPNTLIAFATAPGRVAMDGAGRNSPYTAKLVESMQRRGLTIAEVFRQVRTDVITESNGKQIPWETSSLTQDFYFKPRASIPIGF